MKKYNTTDLDPETCFERHVFHRDQFAHYLRWTHILKEAKIGETIVDFGCGKANLLEVLYRNKFKQSRYIGIDIRKKTIENNILKFGDINWAEFICEDLVENTNNTNFSDFNADKVCSFEVLEHVGKQNVDKFLLNFIDCGKQDAIYYLSTPNFDEKVGAADNHTFDSGDERGNSVQEFSHIELHNILIKYFNIINKFGTFASVRDYKLSMNDWQNKMFNSLKEYYDPNLISNIMAPFFPEHSRNTIWILKRKINNNEVIMERKSNFKKEMEYCRVIPQLRINNSISLIAEENAAGFKKGDTIVVISKNTLAKMKRPLLINENKKPVLL
jgi:2-polyprenyl-3-methyl-5-hydroxy-6-metoxy-1,4-benzoquinol methylase